MAKTRTGARTWLDVTRRICKLSHTAGFIIGLTNILGETDGEAIYATFQPFCVAFEALVSKDDQFNRKDATGPSVLGSEDITEI